MKTDKELFIEKHQLTHAEIEKIFARKKTLRCKCGKLKKVYNRAKQIGVSRHCGEPSCWTGYGVKRPEHSRIMREKAKNGTLKGVFEKGRRNAFVNTPDWKRVVLRNKGVCVDNMSDDEVCGVYGKLVSKRVRSREYRTKLILTFSNDHNWRPELTQDVITALDDEEFNKLYFWYMSEHNFIYCNSKSVAKHYKRSELTDLTFNIRGIQTVVTKSQYETNYIQYFEKKGILWDYEPFRYKLDMTTYIPDFLVEYDGHHYVIEVKGFLPNNSDYMEKKIYPAARLATENNMRFIFTYESAPYENFEDFLQQHRIDPC